MKKIKPLFLLAVIVAVILYACTKTIDPIVTTSKSVEKILPLYTWKLEEARFNQDNILYYYKRGSTGNGKLYDIDSIKFRSDFTGTYFNSGGTSNFKWSFQGNDKTKIKLDFSSTFAVNWENISVTENSLRYTEYYLIPGTSINSLGGFYRTRR